MKNVCKFALTVMLVVGISASSAFISTASAAPGFPRGPIRMLVPFGAGGTTDILARVVAAEMARELGVSVVVENMGGGGGAIALNTLANARPDGQTLVMTTSGPAVQTPHHSPVGFTNREFAPVAQLAIVPNILNVHRDSGITDIDGFLEYARNNRDNGGTTISVSSFGISQHLTMENFAMMLDEPGLFSIINFEGGAQARAALMGRQVSAAMNMISEVIPNMLEGEFIPLAITSSERSEMLPDVPTFLELGYDIDMVVWTGVAAPAGTPEEIIVLLSDLLEEIMQIPSIVEQMKTIDLPIAFAPHNEFYEMWQTDFEVNGELIRAIRERAEAEASL